MELQQVETFHTHPRERDADRVLDDTPCHPTRAWHPLRERLNLWKPVHSMTCGETPTEVADEILGWAVMVGQVPSSKTGLVIGGHGIDRSHRVYCAMSAGNLPHPVQD